MASVILQNNWFAPNGQLFRRSVSKQGPPVDIPDHMVEFLPKSARVVPKDYETPDPKKMKDPDTISEHRRILDELDPARAAMEAEGKIHEEAAAHEKARRANSRKSFREALLEENAKEVSRETADKEENTDV